MSDPAKVIDEMASSSAPPEQIEPTRPLTPQAKRALAEAAERRAARAAGTTPFPNEIGGRAGLDPVRYGDWEQGGIAWDF